MGSHLFCALASELSLPYAGAFSQKAWREEHFARDPGTLCAGLTYFWLTEMMCSRSPRLRLEDPDEELLERICRLQASSYYPAFPESFVPGERELHLLNRKYGSRGWKEIQREVEDDHQGDFVLYDLSQLFRYASARIARFADLPRAFPCWEPLPPGSAVLGVLRYQKQGRPIGHRVAYYLDRENRHHFFDPNVGEVSGSRDDGFHTWMEAFFHQAGYGKVKTSKGADLLTLYLLLKASPRGGADGSADAT